MAEAPEADTARRTLATTLFGSTSRRIISIAVAAITTAVTVIGLVDLLSGDHATTDSVRVEVVGDAAEGMTTLADAGVGVERFTYEDEPTSFLVPVDAPFETLPVLESDDFDVICTPEQQAWLARHGVPYDDDTGLQAMITNAATGEGSLVIKELVAVGELTHTDVDRVLVECVRPAGGESDMQIGLIALDSGEPAVFSELNPNCGCEGTPEWDAAALPGSPFLVSLAPGETKWTYLQYSIAEGTDFVGNIVATVAVDGVEQQISLNSEPIASQGWSADQNLSVGITYGRAWVQTVDGLFTDSYLSSEALVAEVAARR